MKWLPGSSSSVPRAQAEAPRKILLVSLQKCGTHLMKTVLKEAGFEGVGVGKGCTMRDFEGLTSNQYLWSHFTPSDEVQMALEEGQGVQVIFNFRDPRDVLLSWYYWLHPRSEKNIHSHMAYMKKVYSHFSDAELMDIFIRNDKFREVEYNPIEHFRYARVLLFHPGVLNVRFEDLVGARGGGSDDRQFATIQGILSYLGLAGSDASQIAKKAFDEKSLTFRKGQIGQYKKELSVEQLRLFQQLHGDLIRQYGYEPDGLSA